MVEGRLSVVPERQRTVALLTSRIMSVGILTMSSRERNLRLRPPFFCSSEAFIFAELPFTSAFRADRLTFFAGIGHL